MKVRLESCVRIQRPSEPGRECGDEPTFTGGETLARALTVIETAKMSGLNPQAYLADVLDRIHDHKNNRLGDLLPWNWGSCGSRQSEAA